MIEDLDDAAFTAFLRRRNYTPQLISACNSFLFNEVHGTCEDIRKIEDLTVYVGNLLSQRYNAKQGKCSHRRAEGCLITGCRPPPLIEEVRGVTVRGTAEGMLAPFMIVTHCERWYREMNKD